MRITAEASNTNLSEDWTVIDDSLDHDESTDTCDVDQPSLLSRSRRRHNDSL